MMSLRRDWVWGWLAVVLLAVVALQGVRVAQAGLPHSIVGGVPGPGGNPADPSPANPANAANATFYLLDKPAEPLLQDPQLDPADGVVPASYQADVGSAWNWNPGDPTDDQVVVVVEAVRGLNGWTGVNYTSSDFGIIDATVGVQDLGDAPLEPIPAVSLGPGADYVEARWTGLSAANPNVVSYTIYRQVPPGPWSSIGRSGAHVAGGAMAFNDTGLAEGLYCYAIGANYRRDLSGSVYVTAGRSEPVCTTAGTTPSIVSTSPLEGATVPVGEPIEVTFSEAMATGSIVYAISPPITLDPPSWNPANTVITITHSGDAFDQCVLYTFTISAGRDAAGISLSSLPFELHFTSVGCAIPTVAVTAPLPGLVLSGGSATFVNFTLSDDTAPGLLRVWVNYTSSAGGASIVSGQTGYGGAASVPWTVPLLDVTDARTVVDAVDPAGNVGTAQGGSFAIDSTRPTITGQNPLDAATDVPLNGAIRITFSEPMDPSTKDAVSISPALTLTPSDYAWGAGNTILTIAHSSAEFAPRTVYTVTVGTAARDASTPGNTMASQFQWSFTTGNPTPRPPTNLRATNRAADQIALAWDAPTLYTTGTSIPSSAVITFRVLRSTTSGQAGTQTGGTLTTASHTDTGLSSATTYYYTVVAIVDGVESAPSAEFSVSTLERVTPDGFPWILLIVIVIIAAVLLAVFLLRRRAKPEDARPPSAQPAASQPAQRSDVEVPRAEPSDSAADTNFVSCPNCGTMVKPTDAECFVCGARL